MSRPPEQPARYVDKPHFTYRGRVWSCTSFHPLTPFSDCIRTGYGFSVRKAWEDWKEQGKKA